MKIVSMGAEMISTSGLCHMGVQSVVRGVSVQIVVFEFFDEQFDDPEFVDGVETAEDRDTLGRDF